MAPLTIMSNNPLGIFVLPVPVILGSVGLVILVPRRGALLLGDRISVSLNCKLWILPGRFWLLVSRDQRVRRVIVLVIKTDHQEEAVLLSHPAIGLGMELR